jgi:C4-dicarboxylate-specific signal transduction histidine kinase
MQQILQSNGALVTEVVEHRLTQERLEATQADLIQAARGAGMAEVASGVLHNVGNALNSVQTSASVVREGMRWDMHARAIDQVNQLLVERRPALLEAGEDRVALLPDYSDAHQR